MTTDSPQMPPTKRRPLQKDSSADTIALFLQNLEEIKRWYRGATYSGHQVGHVVVLEFLLTHVSSALEKAIKGEHWTPPENSP